MITKDKNFLSNLPELFIVKTFVFWVVVFLIHRISFILYNYAEFDFSSLTDVLLIFRFGLKLDFSFSAYVTFISAILYSVSFLIRPRYSSKVSAAFTYFILVIISLTSTADLALYPHWQYRINSTAFTYLDTPSLALASLSYISILSYFVISIALFIIAVFLYKRYFKPKDIVQRSYAKPFIIVFATVILILPARGGFQTIPINVSSAYHTDNQINNHAAINPFWNLFHSIIKDSKSPKPYTFFSGGKEIEIIDSFKEIENIKHLSLKQDPNILIIVWESLTSKITEQYGDTETVPFLNSLRTESVYFDNFYANGSRSDKGLVSIFSGYYPQAMKSIMKETHKARSLPSLFEELKNEDYKCSFYYGGDTNFGNINSYFLENGAQEIIDGSQFSSNDKGNKWGAYDHVVLNRLLDDINNETEKFCKALFTITSHEPFEIPADYKFGNSTELDKFRSAHHYTDESLRSFIEQAKKRDWWDDTLVVIMADHGHPLPKIEKVNVQPERFKIPMIWLGGALNTKDTIISKICSQVDFSKTLLSQLRINNKVFTFSNDIFDSNNEGFAQYIYTNGFGTLSPNGSVVFDMDQNKRIVYNGDEHSLDSLEMIGKAVTQHAFDDYLGR